MYIDGLGLTDEIRLMPERKVNIWNGAVDNDVRLLKIYIIKKA